MGHSEEIKRGKRFEFGKNWENFLSTLTEEKIQIAQDSLVAMLGRSSLSSLSFLDAGSGSGLFSLAAWKLGARVYSFDFDPQSVECTRILRKKYGSLENWQISEGSVLDRKFLESLGKFDIVYSWGVLHHTGRMWDAIDNVQNNCLNQFFLAIYNDKGLISKYWLFVKWLYNKSRITRILLIAIHIPYLFLLRLIIRLLTGRLKVERGMDLWYDMIDWLGGYPFEVASSNEIHKFVEKKGFYVEKEIITNRSGCNEFVFRKK
jgi:2-polyprenyl-6-hydroxyphenyl methylase/3-demethylubiquinone-9 3-methyltransferase